MGVLLFTNNGIRCRPTCSSLYGNVSYSDTMLPCVVCIGCQNQITSLSLRKESLCIYLKSKEKEKTKVYLCPFLEIEMSRTNLRSRNPFIKWKRLCQGSRYFTPIIVGEF